ncbi:MAG TPA: hypothetical protein VFN15_05825 [Solirubrobacterales bacterium]|nr:hypothetical protein [Solirubrobacterales bacterium]
MALGRASGRRSVSLEEGAGPSAQRCPACGEPLFAWVETEGWGPREDQIIDRCENCGLTVDRNAAPGDLDAAEELFGAAGATNGNAAGVMDGVVVRAPNSVSFQAWLGAENWAALRPGDRSLKPSPRSAELLAARRGLRVTKVRFLAAAGMASMWQTLLNLLTFHRDFASQATSGNLRPGHGKGLAAYVIDVIVTVLAAVPTAIIAVVLEGAAVLARRGGVIEISAEPS